MHDLTLKHNNIHFARWRDVQVDLADNKASAAPTSGQQKPEGPAGTPKYEFSSEQAAVDALDKLEQEIVQQQRVAAQPRARHYELTAE